VLPVGPAGFGAASSEGGAEAGQVGTRASAQSGGALSADDVQSLEDLIIGSDLELEP
jgi:hypothetical protein